MCLFERPEQPFDLFRTRTRCVIVQELSIAVIDQEMGDAADVKQFGQFAVAVPELIAVHFELFHLFEPRSLCRVDRDGYEHHIAILEFLFKLLEIRDFPATRTAP